MRRNARPSRRDAGFTLVELIVASTVVVLVTAAAALMLNGVVAAKARAQRQYALQQEARVAVDAIATALRNAFRPADPRQALMLGLDDWRGDGDQFPSDHIRFFTVSRRTLREGQPESDVREVEFGIMAPPDDPDAQELAALMRRTDPTRNPDPDGGGVLERISDRVVGLNFQYHDGVEWRDQWMQADGWPHAVRVALLVAPDDPEAPPFLVSRLVNFPLWPRQVPGSGGGGNGDGQQQQNDRQQQQQSPRGGGSSS